MIKIDDDFIHFHLWHTYRPVADGGGCIRNL